MTLEDEQARLKKERLARKISRAAKGKKHPPKKEKQPPISEVEQNAFLAWIYTLDVKEYPGQQQIINQMQSYKRPSRITNVLSLWNIYQGVTK